MNREVIAARIVEIIAVHLGCPKSEISSQSSLYHDMKISGDDARDILEVIAREFNISFDDFDIDNRFPTERDEMSILFWLKKKLRHSGRQYISTTLEDLISYVGDKVVQRDR